MGCFNWKRWAVTQACSPIPFSCMLWVTLRVWRNCSLPGTGRCELCGHSWKLILKIEQIWGASFCWQQSQALLPCSGWVFQLSFAAAHLAVLVQGWFPECAFCSIFVPAPGHSRLNDSMILSDSVSGGGTFLVLRVWKAPHSSQVFTYMLCKVMGCYFWW